MDLELARTFLAVVDAGSFVRAAERLHVTQTAVSARIHSLEEQLGRPLFVRNRSGAALTAAGERFLRYAPAFLQLWATARDQVAAPPTFQSMLAIGGELSLWNPLLLRWLVWVRRTEPKIALRAQVGLPEALLEQVATGVLDIALTYSPQFRAGTKVELLNEEKLVLVASARSDGSSNTDYVEVDWGPRFAAERHMSFPDHATPGLFVALGPLGLNYILEVGGSGYFRMGAVAPYLESGELRRVPAAPEFVYPSYAVYSAHGDARLIRTALDGLRRIASDVAQDG